jgi:hypothetical protein
MKRPTLLLSLVLLAGMVSPARTQTTLPPVESADSAELHSQCQRLLEALERIPASLRADSSLGLMAALREAARTAAGSAAKVQKLLDPFCLILVTVNPESRVKALRGPAPTRLTQGRELLVLVKVVNDGGVTQALKVTGPQLRSGEKPNGRGWLEATVHAEAPLRKALSGRKVEYVILGLTAHEAGKREATLKFDVGQGTQDLGFRAEVPILFTVQPLER